MVRSVFPLGNGWLMHLVVAYGFQVADDDAEKLSLTNELFDAVMSELAVVGRGQPCVIAGDFDVEPTKIPCLQKGNLAGLSVDLHGSWARTAGVDAAITCKRDWACLGGTWRDFVIGCPLASAALEGCWVDGCRWIEPYFSVCASFPATRWSAKDVQPVTVSPLWPASWVSAVDKSRTFKSAEVRDFWEIYDKTLEFISVGDALALGDSLAGRDVHLAWAVWSTNRN